MCNFLVRLSKKVRWAEYTNPTWLDNLKPTPLDVDHFQHKYEIINTNTNTKTNTNTDTNTETQTWLDLTTYCRTSVYCTHQGCKIHTASSILERREDVYQPYRTLQHSVEWCFMCALERVPWHPLAAPYSTVYNVLDVLWKELCLDVPHRRSSVPVNFFFGSLHVNGFNLPRPSL